MPKQQPEKGPSKEVYVDLISPSGKVIPTLDWVARDLLQKGWKKKSEATVKKEPNHGEKKD